MTNMNTCRKMPNIAPGLLAASLALILLLLPASADAAELSGSYYGVDEAAGASLTIQPADEGYRGTFYDPKGNSREFEAERNGDSAEAVLDMDQRRVVLLVDPVPFGAKVVLVPLDAEGKLNPQAGRLLDFVRGNLDLPKPDEDFFPPPQSDRRRITGNAFLASYEFWPPVSVRHGYLALPERFRTLIRLFPAVQLDIIWKLCLAPDPGRALATALRGQGVTCPQVIDGIAAAQQTGKFDAFKAEVRDEKETLRLNVRCADVYPVPRRDCERAARRLSEQAVTLETAASVLSRYR